MGCITLGSCSFVLELQWVSFSLSWWIRAWFLSLFTRPTPCWDPAASTGALFRTWWSNILSLCKGFINQNLYWPFHSLLIGTLERAAWVLAFELATVISSKTKCKFLQDKEQLTHCSSRHSVLERIWIKGSYLSQWLPQGERGPPKESKSQWIEILHIESH